MMNWILASVLVALVVSQVNGSLRQQVAQSIPKFNGQVYSVDSCQYEALTTFTTYQTPAIGYYYHKVHDKNVRARLPIPECYYLCQDSICYSFMTPSNMGYDQVYVFFGVQNGCTAIVIGGTDSLPSSPTNCVTDIWATAPGSDSYVPGSTNGGSCDYVSTGVSWAFTISNPSQWNSAPGTDQCTELIAA